ncbi:hypothetical protein [Leucobacter sp. G161]|uniref:hypothetical protein n=1 Tax=Leucobacter sp. G161 TaxID=663704 RepID=UPI00073CDF8F|nr:hypothetical protein [Leucobacter sp. G161]KUF05533.1 hypothetical protein AUL38_04045 [Leucobacter sp. G161]
MDEKTGRPESIDPVKPEEETLNEPVMDGADEVFDGDEDPRKGQADPGLIRHPEKDDKNIAPYNL